MPEGALFTARHGNVLALSLTREEQRNPVDQALADALAEACAPGALEDGVRVVLLQGGAGVFATGGEDLPPVPGAGAVLASLGVPIIAAVMGDCLDRGLELALACDIRVAGPDARFGMRHVVHGGLPADGGTQRLLRLVGRGHALRLLLTGEVIGAEEALRIGLVERLGGPEEAMALAQRIADAAPVALRYTKEAVREGADLPLAQGLRLEADLSFLLQSTSDRAEGLRSFRERRPPKFEGT